MKRLLMFFSLLAIANLLYAADELTFTVNGVSFTMVRVEEGSFMMGASEEQEVGASDDERPVHQVTLSTFCIGKTEVTQELWKAVMGYNPSRTKGDNLPVTNVSWDNCQRFLNKLNSLTGKKFRLPTEAEWEFAARGGNMSMGYTYSGSYKCDDVAWSENNSNKKVHEVATKKPNELGVYDMSGNVKEWCLDKYSIYSRGPQTNPLNTSGTKYVVRGGSCAFEKTECRVSKRFSCPPEESYNNFGFRIALSDNEKNEDIIIPKRVKYLTKPFEQKTVKATETFTVNGVSFTMIGVEGGTYTMGATPEQGKDASNREKPVHEVTVNSFYIGQTEVTQALWKAVMGRNGSCLEGNDLPVQCVSYDVVTDFIKKLRSLTGKNFRLPTEAEWEYAARGGNKSRHFKYSGSNKLKDVAWYEKSTPKFYIGPHPVAKKAPNELGIYDMSGNVWEWCVDDYYEYDPEPLSNPIHVHNNEDYIIRGGAWDDKDSSCRITRRSFKSKYFDGLYLGLRLAL